MDFNTETGTILSLENDSGKTVAFVSMDPPSGGEEECASCRKCMQSEDCNRLLKLTIPDSCSKIAAGSRVEVKIFRPSLYIPVLFTLLLPLIGLIAGGISGYLLSSDTDTRDLVTALFAIPGAGLFFIAGHFIQCKLRSNEIPAPTISDIL